MKVVFSLLFAVVGVAGAAESWTLPTEQPGFKKAPGSDLVQANCLVCHSSEYITTQPPLTRDQWKASITKMQQKYGAPIAAENVDPLLEYLVASYGRK